MPPLVTIGIPAYNSERWIRAAIESALAQTWPRVEVIVVDDGSSDSTLLLASAYGDRIELRRSAHRGANHARNLILREAAGEWIQYLDADDYLEPGKIAHQLEETQGGAEADVIYSPVLIEETKNGVGRRQPSPIDPHKDLFGQWLAWELPQTGGCLWRREALEQIDGWRKDQPCCQEHELYLRALQSGLRFRLAPTPGAVYRIWSDSTLCRKDPRLTILTKTKLMDTLREWMQGRKLWTPSHRAIAARAFFEMSRTLAQTGLSTATRYYRERKRLGLIHLAGPAAPSSYRLINKVLGFRGAETLARLRR